MASYPQGSPSQVARLFLKLGCTAFGGPAAHIAMMRDEVVERRRWLDDQQFLDLLGATNLIPGASSLVNTLLQANDPVNLLRLFAIFLKIGSVLYGSGYVLLAFLRNDLVVRTGWLTDQQLLDAVAVGQFTPGPVFTTATFIGYLVAGVPGALLATVGIFLPSFVFVALIHPLVGAVRSSRWAGPLLDGVNVASLGLMAAVTLQLGRSAVVDLLTAALAVVAAVLLVRFKINSAWLVLGGGLTGLLFQAVANST